ncbi:DNA oxidative demethylase AlkB [Providencia alcalifaciens]|uniref:Putative alkylated DNA repair protein AlkB n=1 Tax=Providencia alcalifaciens DSM 30120 TaxID=520999 RepID=B6XHP0_9GAMM|nr:DNA oxidative demethylase AlkB [Providencia alcalifaciens]ATG17468.1 DNA oxidative demethylase AlkB [Providencia alcalifaciens]EEB44853.1 putative alkylated DNA repair protein AlkB [Providencia alcalifaciens DSM 30120]SQI35477.1 Alpha-ketoglutarate-dependent dioxygenase AlkB [Providencia alcalifaciens]
MLFPDEDNTIDIASDAYLLKGFLLGQGEQILAELSAVISQAPLRHMETPSGYAMSVAMTNCGDWGWVADHHGYRYSSIDPNTQQAWPQMPALFKQLSINAAEKAGFVGFAPDACLINRYGVGAKMSLHQDKDEADFSQPIVSFSLGLPAIFDFGGSTREHPRKSIELEHGDVFVWGGRSRLNYHGVRHIKSGVHPQFGAYRFNLTFRRSQSAK